MENNQRFQLKESKLVFIVYWLCAKYLDVFMLPK